jgi:hypothetical protein
MINRKVFSSLNGNLNKSNILNKNFSFNFNYITKRFFAERAYGGLKDQDRIFTNIYRDEDPFLESAMKRVKFKVILKFLGGLASNERYNSKRTRLDHR